MRTSQVVRSPKKHSVSPGKRADKRATNLSFSTSANSPFASRDSLYSKEAPERSTSKLATSLSIRTLGQGTRVIRPSKRNEILAGTEKPTNREVLSSTHLWSNALASSSDEIMFVTLVESEGLKVAIAIASMFHWQCQRPLRALRAMMNGRGKSYTKRCAKPRKS